MVPLTTYSTHIHKRPVSSNQTPFLENRNSAQPTEGVHSTPRDHQMMAEENLDLNASQCLLFTIPILFQ